MGYFFRVSCAVMFLIGILINNICGGDNEALSYPLEEEVETLAFQEPVSDDMIVVRNGSYKTKEKNTSPSYFTAFLNSIYTSDDQKRNVYNYPILTFGKQAICFGLLFLQQLF